MDGVVRNLEPDWRVARDDLGDRTTEEAQAAVGWAIVVDEGDANEDEAVCGIRIRSGRTQGIAQIQFTHLRTQVGSSQGQTLETAFQKPESASTNQS